MALRDLLYQRCPWNVCDRRESSNLPNDVGRYGGAVCVVESSCAHLRGSRLVLH